MSSVRFLFPAAALAALATACAKSDQGHPAADSTATAAGAPAAPAPAAAANASTGNTVTVTARDFAFEAPPQILAGVTTFHLVNRGQQIHHVQILKFEQGKTLGDFMNALKQRGPFPAWVVEVGGPNAPAPGGESNATVTLDPGNYALVCFVDVPDHVPHVMKGMSHPFTVTPSTTATTAEPTADVTMTLSDYTFTLSTPLTAGTHTIRVENTAGQPHEVELVQLPPGKTITDLAKWAETYRGMPPARPIGGIAGLASGKHAFFTVNLTPGDYGLICFYPDAKDGKPHFMHGMTQQIKVS